ncbi:MAG: outer spore coat protein CotE [Bacilli bacterium]|jgi:spore coat protein E|nr:outer spore coat protein CotE [Acholeplasmataceae bacterium]
MSEIREIVTRAVVGKGKKLFRLKQLVTPSNEAFSVLGCWIINHEFEATKNGNKVDVSGNFEINIWYSYDDNTKTDIARRITSYQETVKVREVIKDNLGSSTDVMARILQQPTCTNARIVGNDIEIEVIFEVLVEVIGVTKMMVTVFNNPDNIETIDDDFENEINEDFIVDS